MNPPILFMKPHLILLLAGQLTSAGVPVKPAACEMAALEAEQRAGAGEAAAMAELGRIYLKGKGRPQDPGKAMEWFLKGAAAGNPASQVGAGYLLSRGIGCRTDKLAAGDWFRRAAEQNDPKGQYNLALLLHEGSLGPGRIPEALVWFKKAADQGMVEAQATLGDMYFMAAEHVARDFAMAAFWLEKAAAGGDNHSRTVYGSMLRFGTGIPVDQPRAYQLFQKASTEGYSKAMCQLADMLAEGEGGVTKQPVAAAAWYHKAVSLGETAAKDRLKRLEATLTPEQATEAAQLALELLGGTP